MRRTSNLLFNIFSQDNAKEKRELNTTPKHSTQFSTKTKQPMILIWKEKLAYTQRLSQKLKPCNWTAIFQCQVNCLVWLNWIRGKLLSKWSEKQTKPFNWIIVISFCDGQFRQTNYYFPVQHPPFQYNPSRLFCAQWYWKVQVKFKHQDKFVSKG